MSENQKNKSSIHFVLQGKGGVGKSFISAILAQYFISKKYENVKCIDTDPINSTFLNYKALNAKHIKLMDGSKIDERNFDGLMETLLSEDGTFIIDNGASSFVPMSNYLIENKAFEMLQEHGKSVYVHSVITGGQSLFDTLNGFHILATKTTDKNKVVWLNEYFGLIEHEGIDFFKMKTYLDNVTKILGTVKIPKRNQDTFGKDIELMIKDKKIFSEAIEQSGFSIMAKQRIKTVQNDIFAQLDKIKF